MDVLMLGRGRPFALEVVNARLPMPSPEALVNVQAALRAVRGGFMGSSSPSISWSTSSTVAVSIAALIASTCTTTTHLNTTPIHQSGCGVETPSLQPLPPSAVVALKQGEEHKEKSYRALCVASCPLTQAELDAALTVPANGPRLALKQETPLRVMHRRALKTRDKHVVSMQAVLVNVADDDSGDGAVGNHEAIGNVDQVNGVVRSRWFELKVRTSAGMYVKEFVHGDFGRTMPWVGGLLGCDTDLLLLDVMDVHLDDVEGV